MTQIISKKRKTLSSKKPVSAKPNQEAAKPNKATSKKPEAKKQDKKMTRNQRIAKLDRTGVTEWLKTTSPALFDVDTPKPFAIGTGFKLIGLFHQQRDSLSFNTTNLRRRLSLWVNSDEYQKALVEGSERFGIDGQVDGEVTPEQKEVAAKYLKRIERLTGKGGVK